MLLGMLVSGTLTGDVSPLAAVTANWPSPPWTQLGGVLQQELRGAKGKPTILFSNEEGPQVPFSPEPGHTHSPLCMNPSFLIYN